MFFLYKLIYIYIDHFMNDVDLKEPPPALFLYTETASPLEEVVRRCLVVHFVNVLLVG